ncbi:hypothetical protein Tco_0511706 [Tanacetum coccineum]
MTLYHALMESVLADEDPMDQGVADLDKQNKRKPADDDRNEDPPFGSNKSVHAEETVYEAEATKTPQNQGDHMGTTDEQPNIEAASKKDWFKKPKRPPTPDPEWNQGKSVDNELTQNWLSDLAKAGKPPFTFNELMSTPIDFFAFAMNHL